MSRTSQVWERVMVPVLKRWQAEVTNAQGQLSDHANSISQMDQRRAWVCTLLLHGDDDLVQDLLSLLGALGRWAKLDDHATSRQRGILAEHLEADRQLADAVCGLMDHLTARHEAHQARQEAPL